METPNEITQPHSSSRKSNFSFLAHAVKNAYHLFYFQGYVEWQKLHEAQSSDLINVCQKYSLMLSKDETVEAKAQAKASFRDPYILLGYDDTPIELDTLTCIVKFTDKKGADVGKMKFYLAEGDEPDSAFRFSLIQTSIVITRKLENIWTK